MNSKSAVSMVRAGGVALLMRGKAHDRVHPTLGTSRFTPAGLRDTQARRRTSYTRLLTGADVAFSWVRSGTGGALRQNVRSRNTNVWSAAGLIDVVGPSQRGLDAGGAPAENPGLAGGPWRKVACAGWHCPD